MRDASTVQQVSDDAGLLKLMMDDMAAAPELYRPGNYWKNYENIFVPEIATLGLRDFRRRRDSVLTTFGATDDPPSDVEYYSRPRGTRKTRRLGPKALAWALLLRTPGVSRKLRDTAAFTGASLRDVRNLCYEYAACCGALNHAVPLDSIDASTVGNPLDVFYVDGKAYTTSYLNYYLDYAYCCRFVDFGNVATVAELGSGVGKQVEVLRKCHPHLCFYLFDIPPQLYVCHQYLSSVFPGAVAPYRETRTSSTLPAPEPGRIFMMGPWKLAEMRDLSWDLFWNAASFQEMEPHLVGNYLTFVNRHTRRNVYLHEAMDGMTRAARPGEHGVLTPTTFQHYKDGLVDFELLDSSGLKWLPTVKSSYTRTLWKRKG